MPSAERSDGTAGVPADRAEDSTNGDFLSDGERNSATGALFPVSGTKAPSARRVAALAALAATIATLPLPSAPEVGPAATLAPFPSVPHAATYAEDEEPPSPGTRRAERPKLISAAARPRTALFDAERPVRLRYRLRAAEPVDVKVELVRRKTGRVVRGWVHRDVAAGRRRGQRWSGLNRSRRPPPDGAYKFVVRERGARRNLGVAKFRFHQHAFPLPGGHSYREGEGDFGAPRSGGRVHEGKDVWAPCGAPVVAARGGEVRRRGYDARLYGHYAVVDGRKTSADLFYVHLRGPARAGEGERIRTGERLGEVGASGNARGVGCMLHLEVWPRGFRRGSPIDPEPLLRAWDDYS